MLGVFKYIATLAGELRERGVQHAAVGRALRNGVLLDQSALDHPASAVRRGKTAGRDVEIDFQRETTPNDGHGYRHAAADGQ